MISRRGALHTPLRRSISEQLRDSTARAWDLLWKNVRERRLAGRCPQTSDPRGGKCLAAPPALALSPAPGASLTALGPRRALTAPVLHAGRRTAGSPARLILPALLCRHPFPPQRVSAPLESCFSPDLAFPKRNVSTG
ncbi:Rho GTPase-activating protein 7 [Fukomys damarensis]|uniref:Rho GTPase-activating protein 7 n=1 Tax=Fukomys damarensis TaxID=885580 RepID=A0A091DMK5_FUKDA|nr:Rho GTPase-activating protein 7 [Fukomys damarensis]